MNTNQVKDLEKLKKIRAIFSKIGFALFFSSVILLIVLHILIAVNKISFINDDNIFLVNFFANLVVVYPLIYIMLKNLPRQDVKKTNFHIKDLFRFFLIGMFVLCVGTTIGRVVAQLLSNGSAKNPVDILISGKYLLLRMLLLCIFVPILEELIFRKLFIDIIAPYGEKISIIFTAFCFALFHGNFFQIFYAFGLGLILGYVYIKSGKVTNTIVLHTCYNFIGGIIPMLLIRNIDFQKLLAIQDSLSLSSSIPEGLIKEFLTSVLGYIGYLLVYITMSIAGLIIFVKNRKNLNFQEHEDTSTKYLSAFLNCGTVLFAILYTCLIIANLIS